MSKAITCLSGGRAGDVALAVLLAYETNGDCCKWIEAMAHVYGVEKDEKLDQLMDEWMSVIARVQDEDGYISANMEVRIPLAR